MTVAPSEPSASSGAVVCPDPFARIVEIAGRSTSRSRFMRDVLRCLAQTFASPYAAIHLRFAAEVVHDDWHTGPTDPQFWKSALEEFLTDSLTQARSRAKLLRARTGRATAAFLSSPVFDAHGASVGAMAMVVTDIDDPELGRRLATLEAACRLASHASAFVGAANAKAGASGVPSQATVRAAKSESVEQLAFAITNELRNKHNCEIVALGMVRARRVRIVSISGLDHVAHRSPGVVAIRAAMEECIDAGRPIVFPPARDHDDGAREADYRLHRQWHGAAKGDAVASIPLCIDGEPVAVLSVRVRDDPGIGPATIDALRSMTEPFAPSLALARRAGRSLAHHGVDALRESWSALVGPGRYGRKVIALVAATAAMWFAFGSTTYRLTLPCRVTPANMRHTAAPFEGVLLATHVVEGDAVRAGDVLCTFDARDIEQQRAQLRAELAVHEREMDRAMAEDAPVEVRLALAKAELLRSKLAIVERRLKRAAIRAPIDGVVVEGDLRSRVGGVFTLGEPLVTVAPLDEWLLELEVPQSAVGDVVVAGRDAPDVHGAFSSYARPDHQRSFQLSRLLPAGRPAQGRTVYVAEARIAASGDGLRPGMEGVARIDIGRRRVWWVWLHGAIDYLRMKLWL